jgi:ankyrin repeat protein
MRGKVDIAAELLGCGAQISTIDETGKTALHHAAFCPNARIASFLIDRGKCSYLHTNDGILMKARVF